MTCPLCHAKLIGTHRWFYLPLMFLGCCVLGIPLALLAGAKYDGAGYLMGWIIGGFALGIPFDRFLEIRFSVLKAREKNKSNPTSEGIRQPADWSPKPSM